MTAWMRTNVTTREEKGIGPVSFKRLLMAGGAGTMISLLGSRIIGFMPACGSGGIILILVLAFTHPVEGLSLFKRLTRSLRGLMTLSAINNQGGLSSTAGQIFQVKAEEGVLLANKVYETVYEGEDEEQLGSEWAYLGSFAGTSDAGLSVVADPFALPTPSQEI